MTCEIFSILLTLRSQINTKITQLWKRRNFILRHYNFM